MRRPTIRDVARRAGVSKSTVSLVLNRSAAVAPATRAAVEAAMAAEGYVYNRVAAGLRASDTGLMGLVINDLKNPFFAEFAAHAQMAFAAHGYATLVANTGEDPDVQDDTLAAMAQHGVAGFLVSPAYASDERALEALSGANRPALQVLRRADARTDRFPLLAPDYAAGGALAAEHLAARGVRRPVFVGGLPGRAVTEERSAGLEAWCARTGRAPSLFPGRPTRALGRSVAGYFAQEPAPPDGVICFNDLVAHGMVAGFAEAGLRVGRDVHVLGFDDLEESALTYPSLTSVRCDTAALAGQAAGDLVAWLRGGPRPAPERRSPVTLVARQSTEGAPG